MGQRCIVFAGRLPGVAAIAAACALLLGAPAPAAARKCVRPGGGGGCSATVQAAIDTALEGETILIRPGVYRESFAVTKRVVVRGGGRLPGQVIINGGRSGNAVTINASGVTLRNLTVWNAGADLVSIGPAGTGVTLSRVILRQSVGDCVASQAAGTKVLGSSLRNCGGNGVGVSGDGFLMRASSVFGASSDCMHVGGDGVQIVGNRLRNCRGAGIALNPGGASALVSGNRVQAVGGEGIYVDSESATVQDNLVDMSADIGFDVWALHLVVRRNIARNAQSDGFYLTCAPGCSGAEVVRNRAEWSASSGFSLSLDGASLVRGNVAKGTAADGFWLGGTGPHEVGANVGRDSGGSCFLFADSITTSALVAGNTADSCRNDGYGVAGNNTTLRGNRARNALFGFHVAAGSAGALLQDNIATMNSRAFCDDTLLVDLTGKGNNFDASICAY